MELRRHVGSCSNIGKPVESLQYSNTPFPNVFDNLSPLCLIFSPWNATTVC